MVHGLSPPKGLDMDVHRGAALEPQNTTWHYVTPNSHHHVQHHKKVSLGPLAPISQLGKTKAPGVVLACPDSQQYPAMCYR